MIGYVLLGTNDLARAAAFYDALLTPLGAKRLWETERFITWGTDQNAPMVGVIKPYDGKAATVGNGTMVALLAASKAIVDQVYAKAMQLGGKDEGPAGARSDDFYAGYFRDLEGNKLAVFHMG